MLINAMKLLPFNYSIILPDPLCTPFFEYFQLWHFLSALPPKSSSKLKKVIKSDDQEIFLPDLWAWFSGEMKQPTQWNPEKVGSWQPRRMCLVETAK